MKRTKIKNKITKLRLARSRAKLFGTASRPRLSIFKSNKFLYAQLINDEQGTTLASARVEKGIKGAAEIGSKIAQKAKGAKINEAVFDRGSLQYHGQVKMVAENARNAGLKI